MSQWHRENPDYQETGASPLDAYDAYDLDVEPAPCNTCGEYATKGGRRCSRCRKAIAEEQADRG